jgi:hypothetical protein
MDELEDLRVYVVFYDGKLFGVYQHRWQANNAILDHDYHCHGGEVDKFTLRRAKLQLVEE